MFLKHYFTTYLTNRAHLIDYSGNIGSISTCYLVHVVVVVVFMLRFYGPVNPMGSRQFT